MNGCNATESRGISGSISQVLDVVGAQRRRRAVVAMLLYLLRLEVPSRYCGYLAEHAHANLKWCFSWPGADGGAPSWRGPFCSPRGPTPDPEPLVGKNN